MRCDLLGLVGDMRRSIGWLTTWLAGRLLDSQGLLLRLAAPRTTRAGAPLSPARRGWVPGGAAVVGSGGPVRCGEVLGRVGF